MRTQWGWYNVNSRISSKTKVWLVTRHVPYTILDLMLAYKGRFHEKKVAVFFNFVQISHGGSESATLWYQEQTSMIYLRSWIMPYWSSLRDQECPCLNCSDLVDSCSRERKLLICFVTRLESVANCFDGRPTKLLGDAHKLMEMCQLQWLAQLLNRLTSN